jgi:hypothetical protein
MIEIKKQGFRFDIDPTQVVTFKKSQNLNGIQARYAYSNTISMDKTANNIKLLELFDLPTNKVTSLMNGFTVDVVLNNSVQLRNQTLTVQKETKLKVETYLLYSDNALVVKLKEVYVNDLVADLKYKKNLPDWAAMRLNPLARTAFTETQAKSGLYIIEEMPLLINMREIIRRMFEGIGYTVFGDFFLPGGPAGEYFVAPNQGTYQVYSGSGEGFSPTFDTNLDAFSFLSQVMTFCNSYADVDDTYRTVVINQWTNLDNYKTNFVDYSKYFVDYQDFTFQSKLARRNDMTYADSDETYNSFFPNNLSSQDSTVYLASKFGAGALNIFDDDTLNDDGTIPVRPNGVLGETSAIRIFKIAPEFRQLQMFIGGVAFPIGGLVARPVSMREVYTEFHKDYIDFILTPVVQNILFNYDAILADTFSLTRVFFIAQQSSYWIPLEINFSTKKDEIKIKAMLIKKRKVPSPILNDFNSVLLNFKERAVFPLEYLRSMYPEPPNAYPWDVIVFKRYDQNINSLYVNDVLVTSASLPRAFALSSVVSIKIEANKASDITPDKNTASIYLEAIDTNGGISNEAFINVKHTGRASLESNFAQSDTALHYQRLGFDRGNVWFMPFNYVVGLKPNLNNTISSAVQKLNETGPDSSFDLLSIAEQYDSLQVTIRPFTLYLKTQSNGKGKARATAKIILFDGVAERQLKEYGSADNMEQTFNVPELKATILNPAIGAKIRVYIWQAYDNRKGSNSGSMNVFTDVTLARVDISTIKTI